MWRSVVAVSVGGSLGCLLRWWLGLALNSLFPAIPPGTLAANVIGAYMIGVAIAVFSMFETFAPEWRLLIITGFCGGLTTFSTFSAEMVTLLQQGRHLAAITAAGVHVGASVIMTFAGMASVAWVKS